MNLPGGNNPEKRADMSSRAMSARRLLGSSREDLDNLTKFDLIALRDAMLVALPVVVELCDTRIKQANSRAKAGLK